MRDIYWKAQDYEYVQKHADWYWVLWSVTALVVFSIYYFFDDIIFSSLIFIVSILLTIASFKKPMTKKYSLDDEGIHMNNSKDFIAYDDVASYTIDMDNMKILINTTNKIQPLVHISFAANQNVRKIDDFLAKKVKKDESLEIPFLELVLNRFLGF